MAYGGNGITYSMIGAQLLRARIERRRHALERLFGFGGCDLQPGMAWLYRNPAPTGIIQATPASVGLYRRVLRGHLSAGAPS
jgi:hypothetical protein